MTTKQRHLVPAFARELVAVVRRALGLTGAVQPGWYRPEELTAVQREHVRREAMASIVRFAHRVQTQAKP